MSHWVVRDGWYAGSRLLQPLATSVGVQVDKLNYVAAGFSCILIGSLYRKVLHPSRVTPLARKLFTFIVGFSVLYFCFGNDVKHIFAQTAISYLLLLFCPVESLPRVTLFFCLGYQSILHAIRMYYDYEGYTLDITGALMMLTQRLSSLAFSFRDGCMPDTCKPYMLKDAIGERPDAFTYFTYAFDFHMVLCGPLIPFKEFEAVTNGTIFDERRNNNANKNASSGSIGDSNIGRCPDPSQEPDPTPYVLKRSLYSVFSILVVMFVVPMFPLDYLFTDEFRASGVLTKVFWFFVYTALTRQQYYLIWKMAEAICNSSNFGYRYVNGADDWSGCTNIEIWNVETAISQRDGLAAWNTSTQRWLRSICYDRVSSSKTLMTFFLSAAWHGFYPGYYLTFMTLAVQTLAARNVRRYIRPHFQGSESMKKLWDAITFATTVAGFAYATLPFILLSFNKAFDMWSQVYFYGHVFSAFCIFVMPRILTKPQVDEGASVSPRVTAPHVKQGVSELYVDNPAPSEKINVFLNISLPKLPCNVVGLDIQDENGRHEVGHIEDTEKTTLNDGKGCNFVAKFTINKVPGNFHVSTHAAKVQPDDIDMSHEIHSLTFGDQLSRYLGGDIRGSFDALQNHNRLEADGKESHDYVMKIVPTVYEMAPGDDVVAYQYTHAHKSYITLSFSAGRIIPAIWFKYDLTPITVKYHRRSQPLYSFLTNVCAIVGGTFTVVGIINSICFTAGEVFRKFEMGKLS